jgi:hypothetical protein
VLHPSAQAKEHQQSYPDSDTKLKLSFPASPHEHSSISSSNNKRINVNKSHWTNLGVLSRSLHKHIPSTQLNAPNNLDIGQRLTSVSSVHLPTAEWSEVQVRAAVGAFTSHVRLFGIFEAFATRLGHDAVAKLQPAL